MNSICLVGIALCYAGRTYAVALVGRMIVYGHVGAEAWLVVMWLAEILPAAIRGSSMSNTVPINVSDSSQLCASCSDILVPQ